MEGTAAPISFSSSLRVWLGKLEQGRAWLHAPSPLDLLDRVHRAYMDGLHTSGMGSSLLVRWLWAGREEAAASVDGLIVVGQLRRGRAGANDAPWSPAPLGYRDVRVDRRGSGVGNPFKAGDSSQACLAHDLLMTLALLHSCTEHTTILATGVEGAMSRAVSGTMEQTVLKSISALVSVQLAHTAHTFSFARLMAWLFTHAQLVAGGQRLRLLCWCCDDGSCAQPGSAPCHARSLAVILLWMAYHLNGDSPPDARSVASVGTSDEPFVQVHTRPHSILRCRLSPPALARWTLGFSPSTLTPRGGYTGSNVSQERLPGAPTHCHTAGPLNTQRQPRRDS